MKNLFELIVMKSLSYLIAVSEKLQFNFSEIQVVLAKSKTKQN